MELPHLGTPDYTLHKLVMRNNNDKSEWKKSSPVKTYPSSSKIKEDEIELSGKKTDTKSRYGRSHKPRLSDDFVSTDKKVSQYLKVEAESQMHYFKASPYAVSKSPIKSTPTSASPKRGRGRPRKVVMQPAPDGLQMALSEAMKQAEKVNKIADPHIIEAPMPTSTETVKFPDNLIPKEEPLSDSEEVISEGNWNPGDLAWGSIGSHPFWPCLITRDPVENLYKKCRKTKGKCASPKEQLHVRFFYDNGRRSWLYEKFVLPYHGYDAFMSLKHEYEATFMKDNEKYGKKNRSTEDEKFIKAFNIPPKTRRVWLLAISEADNFVASSRQERLDFFTNTVLQPTNIPAVPKIPKKRGRKSKLELELLAAAERQATKKIKLEPDTMKTSCQWRDNQPEMLNIKEEPVSPKLKPQAPTFFSQTIKIKEEPKTPVRSPSTSSVKIKEEPKDTPVRSTSALSVKVKEEPKTPVSSTIASSMKIKEEPKTPTRSTLAPSVKIIKDPDAPTAMGTVALTTTAASATVPRKKGRPPGKKNKPVDFDFTPIKRKYVKRSTNDLRLKENRNKKKTEELKSKKKEKKFRDPAYEMFYDKHFDRIAAENPSIPPEDIEKYVDKLFVEDKRQKPQEFRSRDGAELAATISDNESVVSECSAKSESPPPITAPTSKTPGKKGVCLFAGVRADKVCQICFKGSEFLEVFKCKGPCQQHFHYECADKPRYQSNIQPEENNVNTPKTQEKRKRGRPRSAKKRKSAPTNMPNRVVYNRNTTGKRKAGRPRIHPINTPTDSAPNPESSFLSNVVKQEDDGEINNFVGFNVIDESKRYKHLELLNKYLSDHGLCIDLNKDISNEGLNSASDESQKNEFHCVNNESALNISSNKTYNSHEITKCVSENNDFSAMVEQNGDDLKMEQDSSLIDVNSIKSDGITSELNESLVLTRNTLENENISIKNASVVDKGTIMPVPCCDKAGIDKELDDNSNSQINNIKSNSPNVNTHINNLKLLGSLRGDSFESESSNNNLIVDDSSDDRLMIEENSSENPSTIDCTETNSAVLSILNEDSQSSDKMNRFAQVVDQNMHRKPERYISLDMPDLNSSDFDGSIVINPDQETSTTDLTHTSSYNNTSQDVEEIKPSSDTGNIITCPVAENICTFPDTINVSTSLGIENESTVNITEKQCYEAGIQELKTNDESVVKENGPFLTDLKNNYDDDKVLPINAGNTISSPDEKKPLASPDLENSCSLNISEKQCYAEANFQIIKTSDECALKENGPVLADDRNKYDEDKAISVGAGSAGTCPGMRNISYSSDVGKARTSPNMEYNTSSLKITEENSFDEQGIQKMKTTSEIVVKENGLILPDNKNTLNEDKVEESFSVNINKSFRTYKNTNSLQNNSLDSVKCELATNQLYSLKEADNADITLPLNNEIKCSVNVDLSCMPIKDKYDKLYTDDESLKENGDIIHKGIPKENERYVQPGDTGLLQTKNYTLADNAEIQIKEEKDVKSESASKQVNCKEDDKEITIKPEKEGKAKDFFCGLCAAGKSGPCFICGKEESERNRCGYCGKEYHLACARLWPQSNISETAKGKLIFHCPQHACHTCISDNPSVLSARFNNDRLVRCVRCPATYHYGNYCVPAGTEILNTSQIICPLHYVPPKRFVHHINSSWCALCSIGGSLICCELCPNSFHVECLKIVPPEGSYICEDCETGRYPLYGEVVWVKLGAYRWWPARILFPEDVPDNIYNLPHIQGEFVVEFYGTHDFYWVNRGKVFLFHEGDGGIKHPYSRTDVTFDKSVKEATEEFNQWMKERKTREESTRVSLKPPKYIKILSNRYVGNVGKNIDPKNNIAQTCDCDPKQKEPCGPDSDCINRLLSVECSPQVCPAGKKCHNQNFERRIYPSLTPFKTENRGWGLKTLESIKKGMFIIEYVGEVIDVQEYHRRLNNMIKNKDENFYFLTIDRDRLLDAGPKGNVSRFMNHSCNPNCETQKWTVNGDTKIGLFALEDIKPDTELTFNYNLATFGNTKVECKCGASNCAGYIGAKIISKGTASKQPKVAKPPPKKKVAPAKRRKLSKQSEYVCFTCGNGGELLLCEDSSCPKAYHLSCLGLTKHPAGGWVCPWHQCSVCSSVTKVQRCSLCINSYCPEHATGNISDDKIRGLVCFSHNASDSGSDWSDRGNVSEEEEQQMKAIKEPVKATRPNARRYSKLRISNSHSTE